MKRLLAIAMMMILGCVVRGAVNWDSYRLVGNINDYGYVFNDTERVKMESLLQELYNQYSVKLTLLTVPSMEGYAIGDSTRYVYNMWDLGRNTNNQSALLMVSAADGQMHLYVGMGLRGVLTNQWTNMLSEKVEVLVREKQLSMACIATMTALVKRVYNKANDLPKNSMRLPSTSSLAALANGSKTIPFAALLALGFGGILVVATVMQAKKHSSVYEWGNGFERERTGPFGNKHPRWVGPENSDMRTQRGQMK